MQGFNNRDKFLVVVIDRHGIAGEIAALSPHRVQPFLCLDALFQQFGFFCRGIQGVEIVPVGGINNQIGQARPFFPIKCLPVV